MSKERPILFNTEMVQAIQAGRKTQTRRIIKDFAGERITSVLKPDGSYGKYGTRGWRGMLPDRGDGNEYCIEVRPPCEPGDILWVREAWNGDWCDHYIYKADGGSAREAGYAKEPKWRPSIHMPKEAARIFLRVVNVEVQSLQEITPEDCDAEGCKEYGYSVKTGELMPSSPIMFSIVWDGTIKAADLPRYGWKANPVVWVITFERCEKPKDFGQAIPEGGRPGHEEGTSMA